MFVILRNDWWAPGDVYYHRVEPFGPQEMPDELRPFLPKSAKVVDHKGAAVPPPAPKVEHLRDYDDERAAVEAEEAVRQKAEATRLALAEGVKRKPHS